MEFMNPGAAYCIYGGMSLTFGSLLNFIIDGSTKPELLFCGIGIGVAALFILGWSQALHDHEEKSRELQYGKLVLNSEKQNTDSRTSSLDIPTMSVKKAMLLCVFAGCFALLWSPLSTIAREGKHRPFEEPYVTQTLFVSGQMISVPIVRIVCDWVIKLPRTEWNRSQVIWGIVCGIVVGLGYFGYFLGSSNFSKAASYGICCSNNIAAVIIDAVFLKKYSNSSWKVKGLLVLSVLMYGGCVFALSQTL